MTSKKIEKYSNEAAKLRDKLHTVPECSMNEKKTKALLTDYLKNETELSVTDCGKWFYAAWEPEDAAGSLALRADFDAIKCSDGKCRHLCGHDGHAAVLAVFGKMLGEIKPEKNIYLIFQPGEETGEGALICRKIFEKKNIDEIYGVHNIPGYPAGCVIMREGTFACASAGLEIKLSGVQSHAAYPEEGRNPSSAIAEIITSVTDYLEKGSRGILQSTVIGIDCGSSSYGVSAGEGTLRFTVRGEHRDEFNDLMSFIRKSVKDASASYLLGYEINEHEAFPSTENSAGCNEKIRKAAEKCKLETAVPSEPFRWSEDFGCYLECISGAMFGIGAGESCPPLHTEEYEYPDKIIPYTLKLFEQICIQISKYV